MKKTITIVALDPLAGASYKKEVESLFGDYADVTGYSVRDGSATGKLPRADLFAISTDAYGSADEVARHVPIDSEVMFIEVTFYWETLERLWKIPKGTTVLFVNVTETMAREAIAQLNALGVNHLRFIPFYPGAVLDDPVDIALTPGESRYVPDSVKEVIDSDHRPCSYGMMIEMALRLGMEHLLEAKPFLNYAKIVASNHYSFDLMYARSRRQESQFHILMEILNEGLIGVNETGDVFACNKKACQIARVSEQFVVGKKGKDVFPYIPFYQALKEKQDIPERVIRLFGTAISVAVVPVMRKTECIGAFATLQRFTEQESRQNELRKQLLQKGHYAKYTFDDVIGESEAIRNVKEILKKMAASESPLLIVGETGTGKELMAHAVHRAFRRAEGPFIAINVAAMPENLLESELFGYEDGAFTGAKKGGRPGLFEFAHQGTLFLDEVEGMSPSMQVKLLRVLQEGEVMRVGGSSIVQVDVRILAATNESLEEKVEDGSFRKDLYYRLNALTVLIPPLRRRGKDILLLLEHFTKKLGGTFALSDKTKEFLLRYSWPGNIRELYNMVVYFNYVGKQVIEMEDLPPNMARMRGEAKQETYEIIPQREPVDLFQFVMEQLCQAWEQNELLGREKILIAAKQQYFRISQKQVRDQLQELVNRGFAEVGRGKAGSRITPKGMAYWQEHRKR
ncbi:MAG: sigma 54-interacting transcriptional regulator [Tannerellaceae bacterium]|jgi:transcriptional regulator with PAS, ATPase and Fis domain|nr:sigma 54-interacting transcriptional regulator [Tannerellaceae bacterium]